MESNGRSTLFSATLKEGFRDPIEYFEGSGLFVGRQAELSRLKAIISNRSSATVLISGARGSGKTALVRKAVGSIGAANSKANPLVVDVPIIGRPEGNETLDLAARRNVLLTLVRALYFAHEDNPHIPLEDKELLNTLYQRTYYSEEKQAISSDASLTQGVKESSSTKQEIKTTFDFSPSSLSAAVNTIFGVALIPLASSLNTIHNNFYKALLLLAYIAAWLLSFIKVNTTNTKTSSEEQSAQLNKKLSSSSNTIFDLSDDYFETHLKRFLRKNKSTRFVFVFDELDKELGMPVADIIKCLKNLFTLSNGIYVFITAEDEYDKLTNPDTLSERGPECTIFTDSIFLNQLTQQQISEIVDEVIERINHQANDSILEEFKHYLGWSSRNVAFDLYKRIDELVDYGTEVKLNVYDRNGAKQDQQLGIEKDWQLLATLQAYIDNVFEGHKHPWNNLYNSVLLDALHGIAFRLKENEAIHIRDQNYWQAASEELTTTRQKANIGLLTPSQRTDIGNACQDLLVRMEANDNFVFPPEIDEDSKILTYLFNGGSFPSKTVLDELSYKLLSYEEELRDTYSEARTKARRLEKAGVSLDEAFDQLLQKATIINNKLKLTRRMRERSLAVQETAHLLRKSLDGLGMPQIIQVMRSIAPNIPGATEHHVTSSSYYPPQPWRTDAVLEGFYRNNLAYLSTDQYVILSNATDSSASALVVITIDLPDEDKANLKELLRHRNQDLKTQVINLTYNDNSKQTKSPPGLKQLRIDTDFANLSRIKSEAISIASAKLKR